MVAEITDIDTLNVFFSRNEDFIRDERNPSMSFILGDYIYICCYIKTKSLRDYDVIYEPNAQGVAEVKDKSVAQNDEYWSMFNQGFYAKSCENPSFITYCDASESSLFREGKGATLVVLNKSDLKILKIFYFKDTYNMPQCTRIEGVAHNKVIVNYSEYNYVFEDDSFTGVTFERSDSYLKLDYVWIVYPYDGYEATCWWMAIDFKTNKISNIRALKGFHNKLPAMDGNEFHYYFVECYYDFDKGLFTFLSKLDKHSLSMDFRTLMANDDSFLFHYEEIISDSSNKQSYIVFKK